MVIFASALPTVFFRPEFKPNLCFGNQNYVSETEITFQKHAHDTFFPAQEKPSKVIQRKVPAHSSVFRMKATFNQNTTSTTCRVSIPLPTGLEPKHTQKNPHPVSTQSETHLCSELFHTWSPRPRMSTVPRYGGECVPRTLLCHKSAGVLFRSTWLKRHETTETQQKKSNRHMRDGERYNGPTER